MKNAQRKDHPEILDRTFRFALNIVHLVSQLDKNPICRVLGDQVLRSGTSVGANLAEGQAAASRRDFANYINTALKSANETRYWLRLLRESEQANPIQVNPLISESGELAKILGKSLITVRAKAS